MTINNANVEQINVALLDIDKRIKALNIDSETIKSLQNSVKAIKSSLNENQAGLKSGETYDINISGNATTATSATTADSATVADTALSADEADHATTADKATNADHATTADNGVPTYSKSDAGKNLAVNKDGTGTEWVKPQAVKPQTVKFVDYRTGRLTFASSTDRKKIALSNFGPEVTENNVLSFMVIYWNSVCITAQGNWARSQGTGSSGLACELHAPSAGSGWCVIRCVYMV